MTVADPAAEQIGVPMKRLLTIAGLAGAMLLVSAAGVVAAGASATPGPITTLTDPVPLNPSEGAPSDLPANSDVVGALSPDAPQLIDGGCNCSFPWLISGVGANNYYTGTHYVCIYFNANVEAEQVTCEIANAETHSVTVSLSASFPIKAADVSAAVGYSVDHTTSVAGSESFKVKKGQKGHLWWAPKMLSNTVTATEYVCGSSGPTHDCTPVSGVAPQTTTTRHFRAPIMNIAFDTGGSGGCVVSAIDGTIPPDATTENQLTPTPSATPLVIVPC
jgi:hypothetical protein